MWYQLILAIVVQIVAVDATALQFGQSETEYPWSILDSDRQMHRIPRLYMEPSAELLAEDIVLLPHMKPQQLLPTVPSRAVPRQQSHRKPPLRFRPSPPRPSYRPPGLLQTASPHYELEFVAQQLNRPPAQAQIITHPYRPAPAVAARLPQKMMLQEQEEINAMLLPPIVLVEKEPPNAARRCRHKNSKDNCGAAFDYDNDDYMLME